MDIQFLSEDGYYDSKATGEGIYLISLIVKATGKKVPLYIGKSVEVPARCGRHLSKIYSDLPKYENYMGITAELRNEDSCILKFELVGTPGQGESLHKVENQCYDEYKPILQIFVSKQYPVHEMVEKVKTAIKE